MKIKWLGHAAFVITSENGTRILTDPYEAGGYNGNIGYGPISEEVNVVTVSHEHGDHNHVAGVPGNPVAVRGEGTRQANGVEFKGVGTFHDNKLGAERGKNTVFVFTVDGIRVCHAGDLGHQFNPRQRATIGDVDVILVPVGGHFTVDPIGATEVARSLNAKVIIPMHYKTEKLGFPIGGVDAFLKGKDNVKRANSSEIEISKDKLPSSPQVIVLESAL
ncbi:MAG: MBL fold metallo-hydrolase [Chloroflexi bacterium]|nr:MBL fold metallo-hydrolase [Chloroflexota bacterium]